MATYSQEAVQQTAAQQVQQQRAKIEAARTSAQEARQSTTPTQMQSRFGGGAGLAGYQQKQATATKIAEYEKQIAGIESGFETEVAKMAPELAQQQYIEPAYQEARQSIQSNISNLQGTKQSIQDTINANLQMLNTEHDPLARQGISQSLNSLQQDLSEINSKLSSYKQSLSQSPTELVSQYFSGYTEFAASQAEREAHLANLSSQYSSQSTAQLQKQLNLSPAVFQKMSEQGLLPEYQARVQAEAQGYRYAPDLTKIAPGTPGQFTFDSKITAKSLGISEPSLIKMSEQGLVGEFMQRKGFEASYPGQTAIITSAGMIGVQEGTTKSFFAPSTTPGTVQELMTGTFNPAAFTDFSATATPEQIREINLMQPRVGAEQRSFDFIKAKPGEARFGTYDWNIVPRELRTTPYDYENAPKIPEKYAKVIKSVPGFIAQSLITKSVKDLETTYKIGKGVYDISAPVVKKVGTAATSLASLGIQYSTLKTTKDLATAYKLGKGVYDISKPIIGFGYNKVIKPVTFIAMQDIKNRYNVGKQGIGALGKGLGYVGGKIGKGAKGFGEFYFKTQITPAFQRNLAGFQTFADVGKPGLDIARSTIMLGTLGSLDRNVQTTSALYYGGQSATKGVQQALTKPVPLSYEAKQGLAFQKEYAGQTGYYFENVGGKVPVKFQSKFSLISKPKPGEATFVTGFDWSKKPDLTPFGQRTSVPEQFNYKEWEAGINEGFNYLSPSYALTKIGVLPEKQPYYYSFGGKPISRTFSGTLRATETMDWLATGLETGISKGVYALPGKGAIPMALKYGTVGVAKLLIPNTPLDALTLYGIGKGISAIEKVAPTVLKIGSGAFAGYSGKNYLGLGPEATLAERESAAAGVLMGLAPFAIKTGQFGINAKRTYKELSTLFGSKKLGLKYTIGEGVSEIFGPGKTGIVSQINKAGKKVPFLLKKGKTQELTEDLLTSIRKKEVQGVFTLEGKKMYYTPLKYNYNIRVLGLKGYEVKPLSLSSKALQEVTLSKNTNIFRTTGFGKDLYLTTGSGLRTITSITPTLQQTGKFTFKIKPGSLQKTDQFFSGYGISGVTNENKVLVSNLLKGKIAKKIPSIIKSDMGKIFEVKFEGKKGERGYATLFERPAPISKGTGQFVFGGIRSTKIIPAISKTKFTEAKPLQIKINQLVPGKKGYATGGGYGYMTNIELKEIRGLYKGKDQNLLEFNMFGKSRSIVSTKSGTPIVITTKTKNIWVKPLDSGGGGGKGKFPGTSSDKTGFGGGGGGNNIFQVEPQRRFPLMEDQQYFTDISTISPILSPINIGANKFSLINTGSRITPIIITSSKQSLMSNKIIGINKSISQTSIGTQIQTPILTQIKTPVLTQIQTPVLTQVQTKVMTPIQTQMSIPQSTIIPRPIPVPPKPIPPWIPKRAAFKSKLLSRKRTAPLRGGYTVQIKSRKKYESPLAISVPKAEAFEIAKRRLMSGAEATAKIISTGRAARSMGISINPLTNVLFRPGKKSGEIVQKSYLRIVTPKEVKAISYKGAQARRSNSKRGKWF